MRCEHIHDAGPYVLGALSPEEREDFERHLAGCETCQTEVADLAEMPMLLGRLDLTTAQAIAAGGQDAMSAVLNTMPTSEPTAASEQPAAWAGPTPVPKKKSALPHVLDRAKAQRRSERRKRRWQTAGTALVAACLAAVAIFGVRAVTAPRLDDMRAAIANSPVTASLALESEGEGTKVHMKCRYKEGQGEQRWSFDLVAVPKSGGEPDEIAQWTAGYDDEYDMIGHSKLKLDDIDRMEIRNPAGKTLLIYQP